MYLVISWALALLCGMVVENASFRVFWPDRTFFVRESANFSGWWVVRWLRMLLVFPVLYRSLLWQCLHIVHCLSTTFSPFALFDTAKPKCFQTSDLKAAGAGTISTSVLLFSSLQVSLSAMLACCELVWTACSVQSYWLNNGCCDDAAQRIMVYVVNNDLFRGTVFIPLAFWRTPVLLIL